MKPGTQTDTRIRLKGKGVPSLRNKNVRGDHYVTLVVQVPTNLNEDAKEALRKFDEACGNRPAGSAGDSTEKSEKKKKSFIFDQVMKAATVLTNAVSNLDDSMSKEGIGKQIENIEGALVSLKDWIK